MGWPGWDEAWAIRVVWISFRPSEPETWVRILHRPPQHAISSQLRPPVSSKLLGFDQVPVGLATLSQGPILSIEINRIKPESH